MNNSEKMMPNTEAVDRQTLNKVLLSGCAGKTRMIDSSKPIKLRLESRFKAASRAVAMPTCSTEYRRAQIVQNIKPKAESTIQLDSRYDELM